MLLVTSPFHVRSLSCRAVAAVAGRGDLRVEEADPAAAPELRLPDGRALSSPAAAAFALARSDRGLLGGPAAPSSDAASDRAEVLDWLFALETSLWPLVASSLFGEGPGDGAPLRSELSRLDARLRSATFLACDRLSVADVWGAMPVALLVKKDGMLLSGLPHLRRWLRTVLGQPKVEEVLRETGFGRRSIRSLFIFCLLSRVVNRACLSCCFCFIIHLSFPHITSIPIADETVS